VQQEDAPTIETMQTEAASELPGKEEPPGDGDEDDQEEELVQELEEGMDEDEERRMGVKLARGSGEAGKASAENLTMSQKMLQARNELDAILDGYWWQWVDFLQDFGSSESFLIDGDALVLHLHRDALLDVTLGAQHLHLVWLVEKLLDDLAQRGGRFGVFFMRGNAEILDAMGPSYRLAREVVMLHLCTALQEHACKVFVVSGSWTNLDTCSSPGEPTDTEWRALQSFEPAFVMTNIVRNSDREWALAASVALQVFVLSCMHGRLYVVMLDRLSFENSRVHAHLLSPKEGDDGVRRQLQTAREAFGAEDSCHPPRSLGTGLFDGEAHSHPHFDLCTSVTLAALRHVLADSESVASDNVLAAVLCVSNTARAVLPMQRRSFALSDQAIRDVWAVAGSFVSRVHSAMVLAVAALRLGGGTARGSIADLFDGRLFCAVLLAAAAGDLECVLRQQESGEATMAASAQQMWACLVPDRGLSDVLLPSSIAASIPEVSVDWARSKCEEAVRAVAGSRQAFSNPVVLSNLASRSEDTCLLRQVLGRDFFERMSQFEDVGDGTEVTRLGVFDRDHHYHSTMPLDDKEADFLKAGQRTDARGEIQLPEHLPRVQKRRLIFNRKRNAMRAMQRGKATAVNFSMSLLFGSKVQKNKIAKIDEKKAADEEEKRFETATERLRQASNGSPGMEIETTARAAGSKGAAETSGKRVPKSGKKAGGKAEAIRMEANRKRDEEQQITNGERLKNLMDTWKMNPLEIFCEKISEFADSPEVRGSVACEARLAVIDRALDSAAESSAKKKTVFVQIQQILRNHGVQHLSKEHLKRIREAARKGGFKDLARYLKQDKGDADKARSDSSSTVEFQLLSVPEQLSRPMGSGVDERVPFLPDVWQSKLLDVVDSRNSALVVAPTASGKTFLSYYVMERCLCRSDRGIVIFVAPTKALVNQVKAEIDARFEKHYKYTGTQVVGVFTRDFRENELTCQILVCVPQCLQILLMSATNLSWTERIEAIVLDEVHSIGDVNGEVWEQIILLARCPLIMLSATLGDVDRFEKWLKEVEAAKGRKLYTVKHGERWNDLKTWVFDPSKPKDEGLVSLHPCSVLKPESAMSIPDTLKILPEECVALYGTMRPALPPDVATRLSPDVFFSSC